MCMRPLSSFGVCSPVVDDIQCMIAVSKDIDGEQLAFLDLDGLELDAVTGNHYGKFGACMRLVV
jgi:hypothetical protein